MEHINKDYLFQVKKHIYRVLFHSQYGAGHFL